MPVAVRSTYALRRMVPVSGAGGSPGFDARCSPVSVRADVMRSSVRLPSFNPRAAALRCALSRRVRRCRRASEARSAAFRGPRGVSPATRAYLA